ncbi:MAG: hypothetical protein NUV86_03655 [Candidatus Scalindua sp.]|nr:hypothetical protein [Candidatus Scalindua sp.]
MEHKLGLFENSIDSLNEALELFHVSGGKDPKKYKFAILNLTHSVELLMKFFVSKRHKLLMYYKPWSDELSKSNTINLWDAIKILKNDGADLSTQLKKDLDWIKKLRNNIEHYEFSYTMDDVELYSGRIISAIVQYCEEFEDMDLFEHIKDDLKPSMVELAKNYKDKLQLALKIVEGKEGLSEAECLSNGGLDLGWRRYVCPECENSTLVPDDDSPTGYKCVFCHNTDSDEIEYRCDRCEEMWPKSELWYDDYTGEGHFRYLCPVCTHHPDYTKDD